MQEEVVIDNNENASFGNNALQHGESNNDNANNNNSVRQLRWYNNPQNWIRVVIFLVLATFIVFCLSHPTFSVDLLTFFLEWIEQHPVDGALAFVIAYIICNVLMIPGIILSVGAGIVYVNAMSFWGGIFFACGILTVSAFLGSCLAFLNARFLLREAVVYLIRNQPKFKLIDLAVNHHGFKVVFLFRLSPVTPYALFNYLMGFSSVTFGDYCLGAVGMIPNIFAYVYLGASIQNIYEISTVNPENSEFLLALTVVGVVILLISIFYFFWIARAELRRITKSLREQQMAELTSDIENAPLTLESDANVDEYGSNDDLF